MTQNQSVFSPLRGSDQPACSSCVQQEAVFMGNGEQYIWKPPEEDEIIMPGVPQLENGHSHPTAVEVTSPSLSQHCRRGRDI